MHGKVGDFFSMNYFFCVWTNCKFVRRSIVSEIPALHAQCTLQQLNTQKC